MPWAAAASTVALIRLLASCWREGSIWVMVTRPEGTVAWPAMRPSVRESWNGTVMEGGGVSIVGQV